MPIRRKNGLRVTVAQDRQPGVPGFAIEDISIGVFASGYGQVGDGRTFSFHVENRSLVVEVYRPRLAGPVPQDEDIVAKTSRTLIDVDLTDQRSVAAAVRDLVAVATANGH